MFLIKVYGSDPSLVGPRPGSSLEGVFGGAAVARFRIRFFLRFEIAINSNNEYNMNK
jgi:hypothetical protein